MAFLCDAGELLFGETVLSGMNEKIAKQKSSPIWAAALVFSLIAHLGLFVLIQVTPTTDDNMAGKYDYLSSAVWEVFGPTTIIRLLEVQWPNGHGAIGQPVCGDPEIALDELGNENWCQSLSP